MLEITHADACYILVAVLLLGMILGVNLHYHGGAWIARTMDRHLVPITMRQLTLPLRKMVREARAQSLPLHTHINVVHKGVSYGMLQLPAAECMREGICRIDRNPFPPGPGLYR